MNLFLVHANGLFLHPATEKLTLKTNKLNNKSSLFIKINFEPVRSFLRSVIVAGIDTSYRGGD